MPFRPFQLFAFIIRRGGLAAICWAVFLCFATALAQSIPEGYVASEEGDVIVIRPPVTAEHDVAIRVFPPIEDSNAAAAVLRRWAASHRLAGVDAKAVTVRSETLGVKTEVPALRRIWKQDMRERQELLLMPQVGAGHYRPMVVHAVSIIPVPE